jgi:hypothetical protein
MRHAHHKLLPHREPPRHRVAANYPPVYVQTHRRTSDFNPASIAGLRVWLKADALALVDNSPVSFWPDLSGSGNDVAQATGMKQPTFRANQLNGRPVVRFDGIDDTMFKTALAGFVCTHGHSVFAVLCPTSTSAFRMAVVTKFQCNELRQNNGGGRAQWMIPSGFFQVDSLSSLVGLWKVWAGTYEVAAQRIELNINGVKQGNATDAGPLAVGDLYLGSRTDTLFWIGDFAEVLVYDAWLSSPERQRVENYLIAKYALR